VTALSDLFSDVLIGWNDQRAVLGVHLAYLGDHDIRVITAQQYDILVQCERAGMAW